MATGNLYSELEYLILAMVGNGVASGYAQRKQMTEFRGGRWSAESGSVYRVLRRLEADGLVLEARRVGVPNRERTEYEITERGIGVLSAWLSYPPDREELGFLIDPLRTRAYFLTRLSATERVRVVKMWIQENKAFMEILRRQIEKIGEGHGEEEAFVFSETMYLAQGRQEWLKDLLSRVKGKKPASDS